MRKQIRNGLIIALIAFLGTYGLIMCAGFGSAGVAGGEPHCFGAAVAVTDYWKVRLPPLFSLSFTEPPFPLGHYSPHSRRWERLEH